MALDDVYDVLDVESMKEKVRNNKKPILIGIGIFIVFVAVLVLGIVVISLIKKKGGSSKKTKVDEKKFFSTITQITNGGVNAEAYWSRDSKKIVFQGILPNRAPCDQIYVMNADGSNITMVSNGQGRTTCGYFLNSTHIVYSSIMNTLGEGCPPNPDASFGYVWPVYKTMAIYVANIETGETVAQLTNSGSYDAEATLSPDGKRILFTSARDGDLELYTMDVDGSNLKRLTYSPGYDGGAFFSHDGSKIVWRANRPRGQNLTDYLNLLNLGLVQPVATDMDIYVMNSDGSNQKKITTIGGANFAPFFLPDDSGVIFASNMNTGFHFHLYAIDLDGKNLRQITSEGTINLFPMFSPDGKYLAWGSNRGAKNPHEMNVFIAEWKQVQKTN